MCLESGGGILAQLTYFLIWVEIGDSDKRRNECENQAQEGQKEEGGERGEEDRGVGA